MDRKKGVNATTHITLLYCTSSTFWLYKENSLLEEKIRDLNLNIPSYFFCNLVENWPCY